MTSNALICSKCGEELTDKNWSPSRISRNAHICKTCENIYANNRCHNVPQNRKSKRIFSIVVEKTNIAQYVQCTTLNNHIRVMNNIAYYKCTTTPTDNRKSPTYFGVNVAEHVLSKMFKDVERMPYGHSGYDLVCNKGMKIDSKASVRYNEPHSLGRWRFHTRQNVVADYFVFLAFDNRQDLNPVHAWLIPTKKFKDVRSASISTTTINKWDKYKMSIDKVVECCNTLR